MTVELKEFIEHNIELVENNDFEMLYYLTGALRVEFEIGELTKLLYEIGIDPLKKNDKYSNVLFSIY